MRYKFITIEGNIGSGKTSLAKKIAEEFNGHLILESFADNPFLPNFYLDPKKNAFPLELFFMAERFQQLKSAYEEPGLFQDFVISDYLFTKSLLFANVTLEGDERLLFKRLYDIVYPSIPQPQLTLYLHNTVEHLLINIAKRGRAFERHIKAEYLEKIQSAYFQYFKGQAKGRILIVNTTNVDFISNPSDYEKIITLLDQNHTSGVQYINL